MHCRYCSGNYEDGATRCDGCGAPKSSIGQRVLDATKDKESYPTGFLKLLRRITLVHGIVLLVGFIFTRSGGGTLSGIPGILTALWIVPVLPGVLAHAAWSSGRTNLPTLLVNGILVLGLWIVFLVATLTILL